MYTVSTAILLQSFWLLNSLKQLICFNRKKILKKPGD